MYERAKAIFTATLGQIRDAGLYKEERVLGSIQGASIRVGSVEVLNFCANNYLGLSGHPEIIAAAHAGLDERGFGLSSVRFICGTQDLHKTLEQKISRFLGTEDTMLYGSCFDANGGLFETLLGEDDAVVSDELNHASIIDGIRLSKARRFRYQNRNLDDLEAKLKEAAGARLTLVATDGVFSMDGTYAPLAGICDVAEKYQALVMVDDSHATGFVGRTGRGTPERSGVEGRVDVITSTLGKAMGGASGGFTSGRGEIVDLLRQRSRPYLFSNTLAPPVVAAGIRVFDLLASATTLRDRLQENTDYFRSAMAGRGFQVPEGDHPIVPIMLGDARLAQEMARELLDEGVYVIGFSYPVVPMGKARIRVQISAAHEREHLDRAVTAFSRVGRRRGLIS